MDPRAEYTKMIIQDAFLDLLREKPFTQITVTELVKKAGINRTTFYKHYLDVPDLLKKTEDDLLSGLKTLVSERWASSADPEDVTTEVLRLIRNDSERYACLGSRNGDAALNSKLFRMIYEMFYPVLTQNHPSLSETERQMLYFYLSQGSGGVLLWWIQNGMREPPEEIAACLMALVRRTIADRAEVQNVGKASSEDVSASCHDTASPDAANI